MRRIMIEVDCGKKRCKRCKRKHEETATYQPWQCEEYECGLAEDERHRPLRCDECLAAEPKGTVQIKVDGETLGNWEVSP